MTITILVGAVLAIFSVFALAIAYVELQTRGIIAPGGRSLD
jgi:hypothetical protein